MARPKLTVASKISNPVISRSAAELFEPGRVHTWKKGQVSNPKWLQKNNGFDFISLNDARDLADLRKYLSCDDERLHVEYYNTYTTGMDKVENPMIVLHDMDDNGDMVKRAIIIVLPAVDPLKVVEVVEEFCQVD